MANNEILPFAGTDNGTNLLTQAEYNADSQRPIGNQPGMARSKLVNKVLRQTSLIAAAIAQIGANNQSSDVVDSLSVAQMSALLESAIKAISGKGDYKDSCRVATTANIASLTGLLVIDGVQTVAGDRVLVKDQTAGSQNGIYVVAAGAWSRSADANEDAEVTAGLVVPVEAGTANADSFWMLTTDNPIVVGTTALAFQQVNGGNVGTAGTYNSVTTDARGRVIAGVNFARKNILINGGFDVWQRNTTFSGIANVPVYTADRWFGYRNATIAGMTVSRQAATDLGQYALRAQRDAGNTGTACIGIAQVVESWLARRFAGKQVTVSFSAKAGANYSAASSLLPVIMYSGTGTDEGSTAMTAGTWTGNAGTSQNVTLTTTQARFSVTFNVPAGTKELGFAFAPQMVGTAGAADWYELEDVQVELGSTATDFETLQPQQTLALCQRYYAKTFDLNTAPAQNAGVGNAIGSRAAVTNAAIFANWKLPVTMRASPTVTTYCPNAANANWTANPSAMTAQIDVAGLEVVTIAGAGSSVAANSYLIHATASAEL